MAVHELLTELVIPAGVLTFLRGVRKDALEPLFRSRRIVYVVDYPSNDILQARGISLSRPMDAAKKTALLDLMPSGSFILSPAVLGSEAVRSRRGLWLNALRTAKAVHLVTLDLPVLRRLFASVSLLIYLFRNRNTYDDIMCYNSYAHTFLPSLVARFLLNRRLYIDWQDDYRMQPGNRLTSALWPLAARFAAGGVATNAQMLERGMHNWFVIEAHCDLSYASEWRFEFRPGMHLMFAGTLDRIRGAHLIGEVVAALDRAIGDFTLDIAGSGELTRDIGDIAQIDRRVHFHGFVSEEQLSNLIRSSDACLVLQDPRHPFSRGSFPSKIQLYARHQKPILMLRAHRTEKT